MRNEEMYNSCAGNTLYIAFGDRHVSVFSNSQDVISGIEHSYREMLVPHSRRVAGHLQVIYQDSQFSLLGSSEGTINAESVSEIVERAITEVALHLILACRDLFWFHASATAYEGSAVLFPGSAGCGKSTLATAVCKRGRLYLSDDILPVNPKNGSVIPFPRMPAT